MRVCKGVCLSVCLSVCGVDLRSKCFTEVYDVKVYLLYYLRVRVFDIFCKRNLSIRTHILDIIKSKKSVTVMSCLASLFSNRRFHKLDKIANVGIRRFTTWKKIQCQNVTCSGNRAGPLIICCSKSITIISTLT